MPIAGRAKRKCARALALPPGAAIFPLMEQESQSDPLEKKILTCPNCQISFPKRREKQKYCSSTCRHKHYWKTHVTVPKPPASL